MCAKSKSKGMVFFYTALSLASAHIWIPTATGEVRMLNDAIGGCKCMLVLSALSEIVNTPFPYWVIFRAQINV